MDLNEQMRADWNRRAREDARFYVAFGRKDQDEQEFLATAAEIMPTFEREFCRLPPAAEGRRALEIGCGPGRFLRAMRPHFTEVHGVDVSDEMLALARQSLADLPNVHLHLGGGSDLRMLSGDAFDFVYSYVVFQHIPSREIVLSYLREARRVLKPGGILCCQIRGAAPLDFELGQEATWNGCYFSAEEIAAFAREDRFSLVATGGVGTQYLWTTFRKPASEASRSPRGAVLKAVTAASSGATRVPARGPEAAVSLWIDRFPEDGDLAQFPAAFDGRPRLGCYLSPITASGGCQLNVRLPEDLAAGSVQVQLTYGGERLGEAHAIEVLPPPPLCPRLVAITDGINLSSRGRSETGAVRVTLEEIGSPQEVSFTVGGRPVEELRFKRKDPITCAYEFAFRLAQPIRAGTEPLVVFLEEREIGRAPLEIGPLH